MAFFFFQCSAARHLVRREEKRGGRGKEKRMNRRDMRREEGRSAVVEAWL